MKKKLYDAYASDVNVDVPEGMSQAEWEAQQASHPKAVCWRRFLSAPSICLTAQKRRAESHVCCLKLGCF